MPYDHISLEQKWQKFWEEHKTFKTQNPETPLGRGDKGGSDSENENPQSRVSRDSSLQKGAHPKPKKYILDMFPYPSGAGLHVGHPKGYTATDIVSRYYHAKGYNVLHPMGFDAFGLPAENYAVKTGTHPRITTEANIATFTSQMKALGFSYDWDRQVDTTDPEYYKWTQWIFLELFKRGLAYEAEMPVNWCPALKAVLANEEVVDGKSEIGGHPVEKKLLRQWVLRITEYADRLIEDLDPLDWPEGIKDMQRNWIGKSEGCEFRLMKSVSTPLGRGDKGGSFSIKPTAILLHGWDNVETRTDWHWMTSIKAELEKIGYEVIMEQLPGNNAPDLEKQLTFLDQYKDRLDERSIIIGHSMGGFLGMHFVERFGKKIDKLICVAPIFNGLIDNVDWSKTATGWDIGSASMRRNYNPELVKKNVNEWQVFLSENDWGIQYDLAKKHFEEVGATITTVPNAGHFCERDGYATFPALLDALDHIRVYTTRVDTVYGMTYAVMAPDHPSVQDFITPEQRVQCDEYIKNTKTKTDLDRTNDGKEKTGVFTGSYVVNPYNGDSVPLWIADYVLGSYGTGAVMAVPAHDERDGEFAKKYNLFISKTIFTKEEMKGFDEYLNDPDKYTDFMNNVVCSEGVMIEDGFIGATLGSSTMDYMGLSSAEARKLFAEKAEKEGFGKRKVNYKLRDWLFSRQRYWGEPIPLIHILDEDIEKLPLIGEKEGLHYITLTGKSIPKTEDAVKKFDPVTAIVRHWSDESYLVLTFKNGETGLVGGSVEPGETREQAIIREVQEETGYKNVSVEKLIIPEIYSRGYKERKDQEEESRESIYLVKILDDEKISASPDVHVHASDWIPAEKVSESITFDHHRFYWDYFYRSPYAYRVKKSDGEYLFVDGKEFSKIYDGLTGKLLIDSSLPLLLPEVEKYEPSGDGQSPLATVPDWVNVRLASNLVGKRETNTMPQWGGSCWYYLRYMDAHNPDALASREAMDYWQNVDEYVGGAEHAVLHLLYARFWHKMLYDIGVVPTKEPFQKLTNVGMILAYAYERADGGLVAVDLVEEVPNPLLKEGTPKGGEILVSDNSDQNPQSSTALQTPPVKKELTKTIFIEKSTGLEVRQIVAKMSKSLKNVVNPTDVVRDYGADTLRLYEMSMGAFTDTAPWNTDAIIGVRRFLDKVYSAFHLLEKGGAEERGGGLVVRENIENPSSVSPSASQLLSQGAYRAKDDMKAMKLLHKTVKKVGEDIVEYKFNTAISSLMILLNEGIPTDPEFALEWKEKFTILLHPFAPHMAEELWSLMSSRHSDEGRIQEVSGGTLDASQAQHDRLRRSIYEAPWPEYDDFMLVDDEVTIAIQVNGKLRGTLTCMNGVMQEEVSTLAHENPDIYKWIEGKTLVKEIFIPNKMLSIVVKD